MTDLSRLFADSADLDDRAREDGDRVARERGGLPARSSHSSPRGLDVRPLTELVGEKPPSDAPRARGQLADLLALVSAPAATAAREDVAPGDRAPRPVEPKSGRAGSPLPLGRRLPEFVNAGVAILAVVVLVAVVVAGVVHRVSADPAADALVSLGEREAELRNDLQLLTTSAQMYQTAVSTATDAASRGEAPLAALRGRVADGPLNEAESARANLQALAASSSPVAVPSYARADINAESFSAVARAIDRVRAVREQVPALVETTRASRSQVVAAQKAFEAALGRLAEAIKTEASTTSAEGPGAATERSRRAVIDAAQGIPDVSPATGYALTEMLAYASAVDQLRAEIKSAANTPEQGSNSTNGGGTRSSAPVTRSPSTSPAPEPSSPPAVETPTETPAPSPETPAPDPGATTEVSVG